MALVDYCQFDAGVKKPVQITQIRNGEYNVASSYRGKIAQNALGILHMFEHMEAGHDIE